MKKKTGSFFKSMLAKGKKFLKKDEEEEKKQH